MKTDSKQGGNVNLGLDVKTVKGFLNSSEGERLYELALAASDLGPCLEVGSYCGKSTVYLGAACRQKNSVLFAVDHHRGSEEHQRGEEYHDTALYDAMREQVDTFRAFRDTLSKADLEQHVVPIVAGSALAARAWTTPLGLVFIDGGHSREAALIDYRSWAPFLRPGGYLAIHDIFPDPADGGQAPYEIYQLALASGLFAQRPQTKTLGVLQRIG